MILNEIYRRTLEYNTAIENKDKKVIGQYFTPLEIAEFMAGLSHITNKHIKILDAGAGTGMLGAAAVIKIIENMKVFSIHLDLFETDEKVLNLLRENMEIVKKYAEEKDKIFTYNIIQENFISYYEHVWKGIEVLNINDQYDFAIGNPPYKKIRKDAIESEIMSDIVHGQPNLYFLFIAMATFLLKNNGEIIYIVPRSFTSGLYFSKFREFLLKNTYFTNIHLFSKRKGIFKEEKVLQELLIFRAIKDRKFNRENFEIEVSTSGADIDNRRLHRVAYSVIVEKDTPNLYIRIPETNEELRILNLFNKWNENLLSLGFKMKTGPVVDFRATEYLKEHHAENHTVPLIWPCNLRNNNIVHPVMNKDKPQFFLRTVDSLNRLIENQNYLIVKRFTSKEENRRLVVGLYEKTLDCDEIGIENHLNYIMKENGNMSASELYGLFVLFNSSYLDRYYRILNGSTQVNSSEANTIPLPSLEEIEMIGNNISNKNLLNLSSEICDKYIENLFDI